MNPTRFLQRCLWLGAAWLFVACGTTTGGGGGAAAPDVVPDLGAINFGKKDVFLGTQDMTATSDTGSGEADAVDDTAPDDAVLEDSGLFEDVPVVDVKDVGVPKDTVAKDAVATDTGTSKDTSTADVASTCGNGTCGAGETCENCAVDCPCTPCNPLTSTGCQSGEQCYLDSTGLSCAPYGTVADGGTCKYVNDCGLGSICAGVGTCHPLCATAGSSLTCSGTATCIPLTQSGGVPVGYNLGVCIPPDNCNYITNSGCTSGDACFPTSNGKQCAPAGKVGVGGACSSLNDCSAGYLCTGTSTASTCKKRCDTTDSSTCPGGQTCGAVVTGTPAVPIGENFGVCSKP
jgi:hypothetical protein